MSDDLARAFHETYERLAPEYGYATRPETAVPWESVPENNKALMRAVVAEVAEARIAELEAERDDWKMAAHAWQRPDDVVVIDGKRWRRLADADDDSVDQHWFPFVPVEDTDESA